VYGAGESDISVIDENISNHAEEIIVILTISNNGARREIQFIVDGTSSQSLDVTQHLVGAFVYPATCLCYVTDQVTVTPLDQLRNRTGDAAALIDECEEIRRQALAGTARALLGSSLLLALIVGSRHVFLEMPKERKSPSLASTTWSSKFMSSRVFQIDLLISVILIITTYIIYYNNIPILKRIGDVASLLREYRDQQNIENTALAYGVNLQGNGAAYAPGVNLRPNPAPDLRTLVGNDDDADVSDANASDFIHHRSVSEAE
jgi:hypothetical protein